MTKIAGPSGVAAPSSWSGHHRTDPPCLDDAEPEDTLLDDLSASLAIIGLCYLTGGWP